MQLFYKSKNISKEKSKEKEKGPEMTEIIELARKGQLRSYCNYNENINIMREEMGIHKKEPNGTFRIENYNF